MKRSSSTTAFLLLTSVVWVSLSSCGDNNTFRSLSTNRSHVNFVNEIIENDSFNILDFEYVYNGGGVAIADFNNDGLSDLYFTGNMVSNKLYLNKGDLQFEDITSHAGVAAADRWCSGVAVVDINFDGWKDIYVCATVYNNPELRRNMLFVNTGLKDGKPVFEDRSERYGIDDSSHTTNAAFFDYDKDGDLDLYLATNKMDKIKTPNVYKTNHTEALERVDRLFRNDWDSLKAHPVFTDVSSEAGIIYEGYSLGVNVSDINNDGWSDIYVTNDYLTQDLIYINRGDGTFTNKSKEYLPHTSYSAMGNDVVDLNNDGQPDIVAVDMLPEDNYRRKTMLMNNNYTGYINNEKFDYQYQCVRNTLQLHMGTDPNTGDPVFGDVALMAGVSATDWSWTPLVADFDNDGYRDMIITNGFPKDITDRDFSDYNTEVGRYAKKDMLLSRIPSVKIKNYAYRNIDGRQFKDISEEWGIQDPSFSNGAAYGDLDNDGDLDYVVNNINDPAFIYENRTNQRKENRPNWLKVILKGEEANPAGLGAKIKVFYSGKLLYWHHSPYRGYLSCNDENLVFGLGSAEKIDSVEVLWPNGLVEGLKNIDVNQTLVFDLANAKRFAYPKSTRGTTLFSQLPSEVMNHFVHEEDEFIDFNVQPLLMHKLSQYGPGLAIGDVNGDDLDDIYISGPRFKNGTFLVQLGDGSFTKGEKLLPEETNEDEKGEELGSLLFDADGDGDLDLYLVHGSYEMPKNDPSYQDRLYENVDGRFELNTKALPTFPESGSCVKAADYDADGDLDLFVGGRQVPQNYPLPASSYILRNESDDEGIMFSIDEEASALLADFGMVTDALWTDFDNDAQVDLLIVAEWMPLSFFKNSGGKLANITSASGVSEKIGWWNSLTSGDFDNDGDMDYIAGNVGLNTMGKASSEAPIGIYADDFDGNGGLDAIPTVFFEDEAGALQEFPYFVRGDMIKQIVKIKADFRLNSEFGRARVEDIFSKEQLDEALIYKANHLQTSYIENLGNGRFSMTSLPLECQVAPVYGMLTDDFDGDGFLDVLMVGNDYGSEVLQGRLDAMKGLMLKGGGAGKFYPLAIEESGFFVPGDAKALASVLNGDGHMKILASQNRGELKAFSLPLKDRKILSLSPLDYRVSYQDQNKKLQIREIYYGHSFLSQGSRHMMVPGYVKEVSVWDFSGNKRIINLEKDEVMALN